MTLVGIPTGSGAIVTNGAALVAENPGNRRNPENLGCGIPVSDTDGVQRWGPIKKVSFK